MQTIDKFVSVPDFIPTYVCEGLPPPGECTCLCLTRRDCRGINAMECE